LLHGGIVATGLDAACGYAAFSLFPAAAEILVDRPGVQS
jgi:acyl-coenzyme A thioesterase PaaI-like protein